MVVRAQNTPLPCGLIVVGGQRRKVGKTTLTVDLIQATPALRCSRQDHSAR